MEELSTIFGNVGILVAALAGGISLVMFGFAGIQYMTAQGDPQGMSRAKMSVIGAVVGLAIAGLAFVMPGIIIQAHHRARRRRDGSWRTQPPTATNCSGTSSCSRGAPPPPVG